MKTEKEKMLSNELYNHKDAELTKERNHAYELTIEELSKEYLINTSTLKETFKGIYGMPIATYMKTYRIKQAAVLLRQTQDTVADIAQQVGYINQSKFATAFREIMKISPTEYRSQYEANPKTILDD